MRACTLLDFARRAAPGAAPTAVLAAALGAAALGAAPGGAQVVPGAPEPAAAQADPAAGVPRPAVRASALARIDRLYHGLDAAASLAAADALLAIASDDYEVLWRASRAAVVLGTLAVEEDTQNAWFRRGAVYGERAAALHPEGVDGLYWLAASKGRLALQQGPRTTARLAQEVWELAHRVLELDPRHAGAHNILGKLNYEVMTLTAVERFLARLVLGNEALRDSSWELAEHHYTRSVASEPEIVLFRYDLGKMYLAQERLEEARAAFRALLDLPDRHPPDPRWKREARALLLALDEGSGG